jgi:nitroreductase / dihydropteridine reductase
MHTHNWLQWRYATKKFDTSKEVSADDIEYILSAGNLSATSYGLQPFQIVVVTDQAKKEALKNVAFGQIQVSENTALLVMAARTDVDEAMITEYTTRIETVRGLPAGTVDGYKAMMVGHLTSLPDDVRLAWAQRQSYISLGTMMVAAAEKLVDHCPMEGFDAGAVNEILGLSARHLHATAFLALGYRSPDDATQHYAKVRKPLADLVIRL